MNINKIIQSKPFPYVIIFLVAVMSIFPSLIGKFHLGDDQLFHMANIFLYGNDLPFSIFQKIFPDTANNFGYGVGIFYPALPHIIGGIIYSIISIFGQGVLAAETILHFLIFFLSGCTMYWLSQKVFKNNNKALIASLFYITYNYVYVDIIVRDALNEAFMFVFMPMVFLGIYNLFIEKNTKMFYIWFITGYIGMMYSHLVMTVYFTIFFIIFLLFFVKDVFNKKNFISLLLAAIFILIFTSTFTVLMVEHKMFGNYVAFAQNSSAKNGLWSMPFIGFFKEANYETLNNGLIYSYLNFIVIIFFILALIKVIRNKEMENRKFLLAVAIFGILGIVINSFPFVWAYVPKTLLSIQFAWRLSIFVGFGFALVAAEGFEVFSSIFKKKYVNIALIIIIVFLMHFVTVNNEKLVANEIPVNNIPASGAARESFPVKLFKNKDYYNNRSGEEIIILKGRAKTKVLDNKVPNMTFKISNLSDKITVELPRIYYLGYEITDSKGNKINYKEDKYGFITLNITKNGTYEVKYTGTLMYKIAFIIKTITIIILIIYLIYRKKRCQKQ